MLIRHWDAILPGRVLRLRHLDVVDDLESAVPRLLAYCGLEFEPACVAFRRTDRSVMMAGSGRVRQSSCRDALPQWRNYEAWRESPLAALGDARTCHRE